MTMARMVMVIGVLMTVIRRHQQQVERTETDAPFRAQLVGKGPHSLCTALQDDAFHRMKMVEPYYRARHNKIMVGML